MWLNVGATVPEKSSDNQYVAMCVCQLIEGGEMVVIVYLHVFITVKLIDIVKSG